MRRFFLLALLPLIAWADAHIFVYHRFGDSRYDSTNTSLETLRAEFDYFRDHGYTVVPLSRVAQAFQAGEPINPKWVVLTIDDSYKSFYENGLPIFKEYGYPFTLFIYIEATQRRYNDFMSWEQIKESARHGEIGLHSFGHHHMTSLTPEAVREDTRKGIAAYEAFLGQKPRYYAYPYGEYDDAVREAVASFGFDLILNQNSGAFDAQSDPRDLDRTALTGENSIARKLRIQTLPTKWITPKKWPSDGKLKTIHATIPKNVTDLEYYVSGHGWHHAKAHDGELKVEANLPLKFERTRIFLKRGNRQSSIILVKEQ